MCGGGRKRMTVGEYAKGCGLAVPALPRADAAVGGVYIGDLLGYVLSHARSGDLWITIMTNVNVIAVALAAGVSAVLIADGNTPDEAFLSLAREKGVNVLLSRKSAYEAALEYAAANGKAK